MSGFAPHLRLFVEATRPHLSFLWISSEAQKKKPRNLLWGVHFWLRLPRFSPVDLQTKPTRNTEKDPFRGPGPSPNRKAESPKPLGRVKRPPRPRLPVKLQAQLLDQHFPRIPRASGPVQGWSLFFLRGLGESSRCSWARRFGGIGPLRNGESSSWCPLKPKKRVASKTSPGPGYIIPPSRGKN